MNYQSQTLTFLILALACALINAQTSPSNCGYKGIDYSGFSNSSSWSFVVPGTNPTTYYWNVCNSASKCASIKPNTPASCQFQSNVYRNTGDLSSGTFVNSSQGVGIKYTTSGSPCKVGNTRTTTIIMLCDPNKENSVVSAEEKPVGSCLYEVVLSGKSACANDSTSTTGSSSNPTTGSSSNEISSTGGSTSSTSTTTTTGTTSSTSNGFNNVEKVCFATPSNSSIQTCLTFNDGHTECIDNNGASKSCVDYNGNTEACFAPNFDGNQVCVFYNGGNPVCVTTHGSVSNTCLTTGDDGLSSKPTITKNGDQVHIDFTTKDSSSSTLVINSLFIILSFIVVSLF